MIFDKQTQFSAAQAITATAASTNVIDLLAAGIPYGDDAALSRDQGLFDIPLLIQVVTAFDNLTSLVVAVQTDDNSAFSSPTTVVSSPAIPLASLTSGYQFVFDRIPRKTSERYIRLHYTVAGTAPTAGAVTAGVVASVQANPI